MDTESPPTVLAGDWPLTSTRNKVGERIRRLTESGRVRHDILVSKENVGRIIGQRGNTLLALLQGTQCEVFVLDKEGPPPGVDDNQRLVVLVGDQAQVRRAREEVDLIINNHNYRAGRRLERGQLAASLAEGAALASSSALAPSFGSGSDALLEAPPPPAHQLVEHIISSRLAEKLTTAHYAALLRMARPAATSHAPGPGKPPDLRLMYSVLERAVRAHAERGDTGEALQLLRQATCPACYGFACLPMAVPTYCGCAYLLWLCLLTMAPLTMARPCRRSCGRSTCTR